MKKLNNLFDLENVKRDGFGLELLDSEPGAFVVHECSSYDEPTEIARYVHNGTARSRGQAYSKALSTSRISQNYDGSQCDYNVYEEIEAPDGGLSSLTPEELREVIRIANEIPKDIRRKNITLRVLRTLERFNSLDNPYYAHPNPVSARVWRPVFMCVNGRLNTTLAELTDLVKRAHALLCPFNVGDRVVYAGAVCMITAIRAEGVIILDRHCEVSPQDISIAEVEPARNVAEMGHAVIAENIERESNDPRSTKPTARGYLASLIKNQVASYNRYGHRFDDCSFLYHLDNCCAYGVLNKQDHAAIAAHISHKKTGDYRPYIDALCACLVAGSDIANSLLAIAVV